ncbi:hypothetical protein BG006_009828 [Podila minutissima]|uniref:Uncharacterized protein n=1 Tax=Podila minutissima TaxID=64525 RepID=A0A9P5SI18_9FUNG|nr:hypothetical protein BG006_009828 [Podila minutissima]
MRRSQFSTKARTPVHNYFFTTEEWDLDDFCKYVLRRDLTCTPTRALRVWSTSLSTIESNHKLPAHLRDAAGNLQDRPSVFTWTFKKHQMAVLHRDPMSQRKILGDTTVNVEDRDALWIKGLQMHYEEGESKAPYIWFSNDSNNVNSDSSQTSTKECSTDTAHNQSIHASA